MVTIVVFGHLIKYCNRVITRLTSTKMLMNSRNLVTGEKEKKEIQRSKSSLWIWHWWLSYLIFEPLIKILLLWLTTYLNRWLIVLSNNEGKSVNAFLKRVSSLDFVHLGKLSVIEVPTFVRGFWFRCQTNMGVIIIYLLPIIHCLPSKMRCPT